MILGLSFDSPADNGAFREKFSFPFDLLSDSGKSVSIAYGAAADDSAGHPSRISYLIGSDGKVSKAYAKVTPADHPDEVLADLG